MLALLAISCGPVAYSPARPLMTAPAVTASAEKDGVKLRLDLDRAVITPGEVVWAQLTIENTSDRVLSSITYSCDVPGEVHARPSALADWGRDWPEYALASVKKITALSAPPERVAFVDEPTWTQRANGPVPCSGQMHNLKVQPHTTLRSFYAWDGFVVPGMSAPNGRVDIDASFYMDNERLMVGDGVALTVQIQIIGGTAITVSAARAVDVAFDEGRLANWIRKRSKTDAAGQKAAYDIESTMSLLANEWFISATRKTIAGDPLPGGTIEVRVDAITGKVLDVVERP